LTKLTLWAIEVYLLQGALVDLAKVPTQFLEALVMAEIISLEQAQIWLSGNSS
jgi:hypothetical protein